MRKLPPLAALRAFEAAARHMSFLKAAEELNVTPTAISHQIKLLEAVIGAPLFRRRPRPLALTEIGLTLYPVFRDGFDRFAAVIAKANVSHSHRALVVATTSAFASKWLMPRLGHFQNASGGCELEIEASENIVNLHTGGADVAIRYQQLPSPDLECYALVQDHYLPLAAPSLLKKYRPVKRPSDLSVLPLIHFKWKRNVPDAPGWQRWINEARQRDAAVGAMDARRGQKFSESTLAIEAALAGQGVVLASDVDVADEIARKHLVPVIDLSLAGLTYFLTFVPESPRHAACLTLLNWLRVEMARHRFIQSKVA